MKKRIWWPIVGLALLAAGCYSLAGHRLANTPTIGQPVQSVVQAHFGQWIEFFDKDGAKIQELSKGAGSVSIHSEDRTGQDNYTFDATGVITRHQRSYGDDYERGIWVEGK